MSLRVPRKAIRLYAADDGVALAETEDALEQVVGGEDVAGDEKSAVGGFIFDCQVVACDVEDAGVGQRAPLGGDGGDAAAQACDRTGERQGQQVVADGGVVKECDRFHIYSDIYSDVDCKGSKKL